MDVDIPAEPGRRDTSALILASLKRLGRTDYICKRHVCSVMGPLHNDNDNETSNSPFSHVRLLRGGEIQPSTLYPNHF